MFTPATRRKELQQARVITARRKKEPVKPTSIKDLINSRLKERSDSTSRTKLKEEVKKDTVVIPPKKNNREINTDDYSFDEPAPAVTQQPKADVRPTPPKPKDNNINTEDYSFDEPAPVVTQQPKADVRPTPSKPKDNNINTDDYAFEEEARPKNNETFLTRYMKAKETAKVTGPFAYAPKFSYESLVTNFVIDQLRGFSIRLETQMSDMLDNYRFNGGFQVAWSDFKSGDVFAEFQYLPHRVDFSARFDRKVIYWQTQSGDSRNSNPELQRYSFQKIEFGASYPISVRSR